MPPLRAEILADTPIADARSAARRTLRLRVPTQSSGDATTALVHNLSETGLLLETSARFEVGEALQVELPHAGRSTALVVWTREKLVGCEFVSPVSRASVSAALLKSPIDRAPPVAAQAVGSRAGAKQDPVEWEQSFAARTVLIVSLLVALLTVGLFVMALLTAPFSTL